MTLGRILSLAVFLRILGAIFNPGFLSYDDYQSVIRLVIPAQNISGIGWIVQESELRSPLVRIVLFFLSSMGYSLGLEDPIHQLRLVYLFVGLTSILSVYLAYRSFEILGRIREARIAATVLSLHFFMPYLNTRVMFENIGMLPFFASIYFCFHYFYKIKNKSFSKWTHLLIYLSVALLGIASVARPQVGAIILIWPLIFFIKFLKQKKIALLKPLGHVVLSGVLVFLIIGFVDQYLRGSFHQTLRLYFEYNMAHSKDYGVKPFYYYLPVLLGLVQFPFLIRFKGWPNFKEKYADLLPFILSFILFFALHSLVGHKEERFLYPTLPLVFVLISPWIAHLWESGCQRHLQLLGIANVIMGVAICLSPAQWNVVGLVKHFEGQANVGKIISYKDSVGMYPLAYSREPLPAIQYMEEKSMDTLQTNDSLVVRKDYLEAFVNESQLTETASFCPGPLESFVIFLNPKKNRRRDCLHIFQLKKT